MGTGSHIHSQTHSHTHSHTHRHTATHTHSHTHKHTQTQSNNIDCKNKRRSYTHTSRKTTEDISPHRNRSITPRRSEKLNRHRVSKSQVINGSNRSQTHTHTHTHPHSDTQNAAHTHTDTHSATQPNTRDTLSSTRSNTQTTSEEDTNNESTSCSPQKDNKISERRRVEKTPSPDALVVQQAADESVSTENHFVDIQETDVSLSQNIDMTDELEPVNLMDALEDELNMICDTRTGTGIVADARHNVEGSNEENTVVNLNTERKNIYENEEKSAFKNDINMCNEKNDDDLKYNDEDTNNGVKDDTKNNIGNDDESVTSSSDDENNESVVQTDNKMCEIVTENEKDGTQNVTISHKRNEIDDEYTPDSECPESKRSRSNDNEKYEHKADIHIHTQDMGIQDLQTLPQTHTHTDVGMQDPHTRTHTRTHTDTDTSKQDQQMNDCEYHDQIEENILVSDAIQKCTDLKFNIAKALDESEKEECLRCIETASTMLAKVSSSDLPEVLRATEFGKFLVQVGRKDKTNSQNPISCNAQRLVVKLKNRISEAKNV